MVSSEKMESRENKNGETLSVAACEKGTGGSQNQKTKEKKEKGGEEKEKKGVKTKTKKLDEPSGPAQKKANH